MAAGRIVCPKCNKEYIDKEMICAICGGSFFKYYRKDGTYTCYSCGAMFSVINCRCGHKINTKTSHKGGGLFG